MSKPIRIRTNTDAFALIAQLVEAGRIEQPEAVTEDGEQLLVYVHTCNRCRGSGDYCSVETGRVGACWSCNGRKVVSKRLPPVVFARRIRANLRARDRRAAAKARRIEAAKARNTKRGYGAVTGGELFQARARATARRRRSCVELRAHVGSEGEAVEASVVMIAAREVDTRYGTRVVHIFLDDAGNMLTLWANERLEVEGERPRLRLRATVKRHTTWRGEARTEVQDLEVLAVEGEEPVFSAAELLVAADYLEAAGSPTLADVERQALAAGDAPEWLVRELSEHPAVRRGVFSMRGQLARRAA